MGLKQIYVKESNLNDSYRSGSSQLEDIFFLLKLQIILLVIVTSSFILVDRSINAKINSPISAAMAMESNPQVKVLGTSVVEVETVTPAPTVVPSPIPTQQPIQVVEITPTVPQPTIVRLPKDIYSVAIIGDSMVDTMGERLEYLEHALKKKYPQTNFTLYNYGRGAQNVEEGLARLHSAHDNQDRHYAPLDDVKPDILIVGSFAYNPFSPHDIGRYQSNMTKFIQEAKSLSNHVYVLAEIAPLKVGFGKGPGGVNWDDETSYQQATKIIEQMETEISISQSQSLPLINTFNPSQAGGDKSGNPKYVNSNDGIHPSVAGHEFMADIIANTIRFD